jgi:hypothetical protein
MLGGGAEGVRARRQCVACNPILRRPRLLGIAPARQAVAAVVGRLRRHTADLGAVAGIPNQDQRVRMRTTTERGYGASHRAQRRRWQAKLEHQPTPCVCTGHCGRHHGPCSTILTNQVPWDLGHNDDRTAWVGPECVPCNRAAGARSNTRTFVVRDW